MSGAVIDQRLRVEIPDPPASLSVWIIDPSNETIRENEGGLWFKTIDNLPRKTQAPEATVLVLHGYHHPKNNWAYLMWARFFAQSGYRVVLIDLRGHGGSSGDWHTFGVQEAKDLSIVIDKLDHLKLLKGKLGVFGGSYGGATAIQLAGIDSRIQAIITVSAYSSLREVAKPFINTQLGWLSGLVGIWGYDAIVDHAGRVGGFDPDATDGRQALRKTKAKVLLIHSNNDQHVPVAQARLLAEAAKPYGKLLLIDGPDHFGMGVDNTKMIRNAAASWFEKHLR